MKIVINTCFGGFGLSEKAKKWLSENGYEYETYLEDEISFRTNELVIKCIEELGEESFGDFAELKIIDIPDNLKFTIEYYDGKEHIAKIHRKWF